MPELKSLRIIFMGTPEFAVASLDKLVKAGLNIVGVITAPDKPGGRGMQLQQSAVKKYAVENKLNVIQPEKLKNSEFINELESLKADVQIVVAFRMLPEIVWSMPPLGTINVHGSLLPDYRGAAPINWAIINGEHKTGVTTFKLQQQIDTGNILLQKEIPISDNETAGELHDVMKEVGAELLLQTLVKLSENKLEEVPQNLSIESKHAPKIFTSTCEIDWAKSAAEVHNLIRGLSPYPAAFTTLDNKKFKIFGSLKTEKKSTTPGTIETDNKNNLFISCGDKQLEITEVQLEGKRKMPITDFLRGYRFLNLSVS